MFKIEYSINGYVIVMPSLSWKMVQMTLASFQYLDQLDYLYVTPEE